MSSDGTGNVSTSNTMTQYNVTCSQQKKLLYRLEKQEFFEIFSCIGCCLTYPVIPPPLINWWHALFICSRVRSEQNRLGLIGLCCPSSSEALSPSAQLMFNSRAQMEVWGSGCESLDSHSHQTWPWLWKPFREGSGGPLPLHKVSAICESDVIMFQMWTKWTFGKFCSTRLVLQWFIVN